MSDERIAREALRRAQSDAEPDASRLVANVPAMMREARRRRSASVAADPTLPELAGWAIPRLAAVTAVAVIAAAGVASWERGSAGPPPATIESVILGSGGDGTGDVVFDALLDVGRSDG
jgi:hypothetical protein